MEPVQIKDNVLNSIMAVYSVTMASSAYLIISKWVFCHVASRKGIEKL